MSSGKLEIGQPFIDRRTLTRGGSGGILEVRYTAASDSEMKLVGGSITNKDTVARTATVALLDGSNNELVKLNEASVNADARLEYPVASASFLMAFGIIISGALKLSAKVAAVAATEDAIFAVIFRYSGGQPTVTEVNA